MGIQRLRARSHAKAFPELTFDRKRIQARARAEKGSTIEVQKGAAPLCKKEYHRSFEGPFWRFLKHRTRIFLKTQFIENWCRMGVGSSFSRTDPKFQEKTLKRQVGSRRRPK